MEVEIWKKCTQLLHEAHLLQTQDLKNLRFGTLLVAELFKKGHPVVVRSIFRSQNAKSTSVSDHFCKLRCRKSAREAPLGVKSAKTDGLGPLFAVRMRFWVAGAMDSAPCQK